MKDRKITSLAEELWEIGVNRVREYGYDVDRPNLNDAKVTSQVAMDAMAAHVLKNFKRVDNPKTRVIKKGYRVQYETPCFSTELPKKPTNRRGAKKVGKPL